MEAVKSFFAEVKRGSFSPEILPDDEKLLGRFKGCLAGALIGDCLGAFFEVGNDYSGKTTPFTFLADLDGGLKLMKSSPKFTDDTVFTVALADSLIERDGYDAEDFAKRFVAAYKKYPRRGYGNNMGAFVAKLEENKCKDPQMVAQAMFDGSGSCGNGAAMRIAPVALLFFDDEKKLITVAEESSKSSHAHRLGYQGAILLAMAIELAMQVDSNAPIHVESFLEELTSKMAAVEGDLSVEAKPVSDSIGGLMATVSYAAKLDLVREMLELDAPKEQIRERLGVETLAHRSVPTAIYCFLRGQTAIKGFYSNSAMERIIALSLDLGGDTDTIASMAAAICGAHVGFDGIPKKWFEKCEAHDRTVKIAEKLYAMYKRHNNAKPKRSHEHVPRGFVEQQVGAKD